jgi:hypothetical protein
MKRFLKLPNVVWGLVYLAVVAAIVWQLGVLRASVLARLGTPAAQAEWEQWRADATKPGPVARREPKSNEPPALVLLRDYYGVCLGAAIFFSSLLFLVTMLLARGAWANRSSA